MAADQRYDYEEPATTAYNKMVDDNLSIILGPAFLLDLFPWMVNVLPKFMKDKFMKINVLERNRDMFIDKIKVRMFYKKNSN